MRQLCATFCVTSSLALGDSDPSSRFHLQTLSFSKPLVIEGPIRDTTSISLVVVAGMMCEE
jgi:hypothetical protein